MEEIGRARLHAASIGPAQIGFGAEHPFPNLIVIPDFTAAKETGKVRVNVAAVCEIPIRVSPVNSEIRTDVETTPIIRCRGSLVNRRLGKHGAPPARRAGAELVRKAARHAPALDVVSGPIVAAQITDPARIHESRCDADAKLAVGAEAAGRDGRTERWKGCPGRT